MILFKPYYPESQSFVFASFDTWWRHGNYAFCLMHDCAFSARTIWTRSTERANNHPITIHEAGTFICTFWGIKNNTRYESICDYKDLYKAQCFVHFVLQCDSSDMRKYTSIFSSHFSVFFSFSLYWIYKYKYIPAFTRLILLVKK